MTGNLLEIFLSKCTNSFFVTGTEGTEWSP